MCRGRWRRQVEIDRRARLALEHLTPGGSEFFNNPEYCEAYLRERLHSGHKEEAKELATGEPAESVQLGRLQMVDALKPILSPDTGESHFEGPERPSKGRMICPEPKSKQ